MPKSPPPAWLAPCPCGSGLRLSQCCGPNPQTDMPPAWLEAHRLWELSRRILVDYLRVRHSAAAVAGAFAQFGRPPEPGLWEEQDWLALVESWVLYDWLAPGTDQTIAAEWLARAAPTPQSPGSSVIELVQATVASPLSFYQVERIVPALGVEVRDLLRDGTTFVHDRSLSLSASRWRIVCARLLPWSGVTIMDTMGPYPLPADWRSRIWDELTGDGLEPPLETAELRELGEEIFELYDNAVDADLEAHRTPMRLANTDGDPMVFCEQTYRFSKPELSTILDRLQDLGFEAHEDLRLDDPDQDLDNLGDIELHLVDGDRELLPGGGPVEVAKVVFAQKPGGTVVLQTNSRERQVRFASMLESELCPLIERGESHERDQSQFERWNSETGWRDQSDPEERAEAAGPLRPEDLTPEGLAMLKAELARVLQSASRAWLDEHVPALDGLTPREAVRTESGRHRVEDLLRSFAIENPDPHGLCGGLDQNLIRRELGLPLNPDPQ